MRRWRRREQAEKDIGSGRYLGPLHGLPFGVKDQLFTRGIRTTCGSRVHADHVPDHDAAVIERLQRGGRDPDRQGEPARVRQRRHERLSVRAAAQSVEPRAQPGGLVERLGNRARIRLFLGLARRGHRRLDPQPRRGERHRRHPPDLRAREPLRRRHVRLDRRHDRPADANRGRQRAFPGGDRGPRRARSAHEHAPGAGLSRAAQAGSERPQARRRARDDVARRHQSGSARGARGARSKC